ncbi:hypothetical protein XA68_12244 [Ophiocordyceps unilateralis]|uniref:Uncharacterized protein n=1 Tax=Ophiocordyceps unilateralis TaxID=268505 RepID=A0A2A9PF26_OPHUN|nr:hypothetical protein XA68_12244 [Ophiocordyceps unilateralis]
MKVPTVWLLLLWQAASVLGTNAQYYRDTHPDRAARRDPNNDALGPKADAVDEEQAQPVVRQPGADLVDAALAELRTMPRSSHAKRRQSSGLLGFAFRYIMKTVPIVPASAPTQDKPSKSPGGALLHVVELLQQAADQNNSDALLMLAEFNFFGNYSHPRNLETAFRHYNKLATNHGNTTAQYMLGIFHSTGIGGVVPRDQAKALLYYTFAAARGDTRAEMATAFRHHGGIGAVKDCETAVKYYKRVADKAIKWYRSGPPGGMSWVHQSWRISDDDGGIYGEGASVSSAGINSRKASPHSDAHAAIGDVIEYLDLVSQKGDSKASYNLGRIYYEGQRGLDKDFDLARRYFFLVASRYWKRDSRIVESHTKEIEKMAGKAAGFIGRMYLRGDGVVQNPDRAKVWFDRGISLADAQSQYGRGLMLLNGLGGKENVKLAMELFAASANQDYAPAQVQMGRLYLDQGGPDDVRIANNHFELAARHGNIEAHHYLAEMVYNGVGREKLCGLSMNYYKTVAEKAEPLVSLWADANEAYEAGDLDLALLGYLMAAEQGYEKAQTNVAYMLDPLRSRMAVTGWMRKAPEEGSLLKNPGLALIYWTRSSRQANVDALVKMGDYYFYGIGTPRDVNKAVQCYTGASDYSQSAQALFNLGWMHENGIGLTQDFHLAKRYYDHALEVNEEAYLPVTLSLLKLRLRSAWNTLTHGPIHSIQDEPKKSKDWSLAEWIANFLEDDTLSYEEETREQDSLDGTMGTGEEVLEDGGVLESVLIIGVTTALVLLLWWRQRMQQGHGQADEERRRNQGQAEHPRPANGADGFREWAAGGGMG